MEMDELDLIVAGFVTLFYPHVEAVLHDVENDRIAKLWNAYSKRSVGEESLLDSDALIGAKGESVMGPFEQVFVDGRKATSVSVPLQNGRYLLCLNFDRAPFDDAIALLQKFAVPLKLQPTALSANDWQGQMNQVIEDWCRANERHRSALTRQDRLSIVARLEERGLFSMRKSADHAAKALEVSRSGIYQLLGDVRGADRVAK